MVPGSAQLRNIAIGMMPDTSYLTPAEAWEEAVKCRPNSTPEWSAAITAPTHSWKRRSGAIGGWDAERGDR